MPTETAAEIDEASDVEVAPVLELLRELTGITISLQKKTMVVFRLRKRLAQLGRPALPVYADRVRKDRSEQQAFINLLTTNETSFFRTPRVWTYFREQYLPRFHASNPGAILHLWSAAASSGEEGYSIAMSCHDFQQRHPSFRYTVLASDVDTEVLARAESGRFCARTAEKLRSTHPEMFHRHFSQGGSETYEIDPQLRKHMKFTLHNLMERPRLSAPQNAIFLRNVLIYFREREQEQILGQVASAMLPGAVLIIGESESISALAAPFAFVQPQVYERSA